MTFTGRQVELLYFIQITEKGVAESRLSDIYFQEKSISKYTHYLKIVRSRSISMNQLAVLLSDNIYLSPDEIYDIYADINTSFLAGHKYLQLSTL